MEKAREDQSDDGKIPSVRKIAVTITARLTGSYCFLGIKIAFQGMKS